MAEEGAVLSVHSVDEWQAQFQKAKDAKKLVVIDFTATWCGPCRNIAPIFAEMAKKFTDVAFIKVDVDELRTVSEEWQVEAMPTFIILKKGNVLEKIVGAKKDELQQKVALHAAK